MLTTFSVYIYIIFCKEMDNQVLIQPGKGAPGVNKNSALSEKIVELKERDMEYHPVFL